MPDTLIKRIPGPLTGMLLFVLSFTSPEILSARTVHVLENLKWHPTAIVRTSPADSFLRMSFEGCIEGTGEFRNLPLFKELFRLESANEKIREVRMNHPVFLPLGDHEIKSMSNASRITDTIGIGSRIVWQAKIRYLEVTFLPFRINSITGKTEKLVSFELEIELETEHSTALPGESRHYADHSVLSQGTWIKMAVPATGMYVISYSDLRNMGVEPDGIDPRNIRIFGNGGGMLPEANSGRRTDDLAENAILVAGEEDGIFHSADYILFYGEGPDTWSYSPVENLFHHARNLYSDYAYYFLTYDQGPGKRIQAVASSTQSATDVIDRFNDFSFYEKNDLSLIKSGKEWYDIEVFDVTTSRNYSFSFPNLVKSVPVFLRADLAARSTGGGTSFTVLYQSASILVAPIPPTSSDWLAPVAKQAVTTNSFTAASDVIDLTLKYNKLQPDGVGYLNSLEMNVVRMLNMAGSQMGFRSSASVGSGRICEYRLSSAPAGVVVLDVTDPAEVKKVQGTFSAQQFTFRLPGDTLREFLAFDGSAFLSIASHERIANQDLHGTGPTDYVIVSAPEFLPEAERLAQFHRQHDQFSVLVTTPQLIYNEFSSGSQDVSAIRDFMKMLYDRGSVQQVPKYLLLFGDASYDYKNRVQDNTNFVPTYESGESLDPVDTFVTDDFFGLLDDTEGQYSEGYLDIGIGRFPVRNGDEARNAVDKVLHYCENSETVKNDWRNVVCFVADDEDNNLHLNQAESLTSMIFSQHRDYNIDKIYLDSYNQVSTPGGARYPEVNEAINKRVDKGALLINYIGHGGTLGWAHERVLEIPDIKSWTNFDNMPAFVTATCEFSQFDDPGQVSAGEWVFLNPAGGGIALFTTTRPTFAGSNFELTSHFYQDAFDKVDGRYYKMGDLILKAKNSSSSSSNTRKFVLLGDPGLQLAYPEYHVMTTHINGKPVGQTPDTLTALSEMSVSGEVRDDDGMLMNGFDGTLFPIVYDKASQLFTQANDGGTPQPFSIRKNIIYKGKVEISGGKFTFSFLCPKDISYQYGGGRISYYARDGETDANGYDDDLVVGGYNGQASADTTGPLIRLYMNDQNFVSGGITDQNPILLAAVEDESGINTVGNGIGHDITAILDGDTQNPFILNEYYVADYNTFKSGTIAYPFFNLSEGEHTITFKVWDIYNNSSEASIGFRVSSRESFTLEHLLNFPNPFRENTTFSFEFNQPNASMDVVIRIFSLNGTLVKSIRQNVTAEGYRVQSIGWDGTSDTGLPVGSGTYVYSLQAILPNGATVIRSAKLVYLR